MPRDPLQIVLLIRRRAVEDLRNTVAASLEAEKTSMAVITAIDHLVDIEKAEANRLSGQALAIINGQMDMLGNRLGQFRYLRRKAAADLIAAQAGTLQAVADLAAARSSERIIEQLIERRDAAQQKQQDIRDGHNIDDIARYRHRKLNVSS